MSSLRDDYLKVKYKNLPRIPGHMRTMRQITLDEKLSPSHVLRMVTTLVDSKAWVKKKYKVQHGDALRMIWYYGPKQ